MTDTRSSITIVGGGPCGLAAALALARRGVAVDLVERSERLGGMAASIDVGGIRVDLGSHRLHPARSDRVGALLDDLLGDDLQVRPRNGRLRLHDRWLHFPLRFGELLTALPRRAAAAAAFDLVGTMLPGRSTATAASYADVVRRGLGPSALSTFHGPMAEKLWGVPPEQLSAELAHKRVSVRSPLALLRTLAKGDDERVFLSPRRGYGQIVDSLADAAVAAGATIRTGVGVERVVADETAPTVRLDDGTELRPSRVLWTAPPDALLRAVDPATAPDGVPHRALVLVFLVVPETRYLDVDAHYVPDLDVAFSRLSEPRNYRDGDDPDDRTVLCAEVPCTVGDEIWVADDAALGDLAGRVEVEAIMNDPASISQVNTPLWDQLAKAARRPFPTSRLTPGMSVGFTDARIYREMGAVAYGAGLLSPFVTAGEFGSRFHGNDERIDVESLELSTQFWLDVIT